jgi:Spy/CpxP family protein refolding chaperone
MKKTLFAVFALLFSFGMAMAQQELASAKKDPVQRAERFTKKMVKELNLDQAQQERMKGINLERFKQLDEVKNTFAADKKTLQTKVKEINDNYFLTVKGVLSPEQFTKFQEMKEEIKEKAMARRQAKKG